MLNFLKVCDILIVFNHLRFSWVILINPAEFFFFFFMTHCVAATPEGVMLLMQLKGKSVKSWSSFSSTSPNNRQPCTQSQCTHQWIAHTDILTSFTAIMGDMTSGEHHSGTLNAPSPTKVTAYNTAESLSVLKPFTTDHSADISKIKFRFYVTDFMFCWTGLDFKCNVAFVLLKIINTV